MLLSFLVRSLPPCSSRDIPVYLPYGSPKVMINKLSLIALFYEVVSVTEILNKNDLLIHRQAKYHSKIKCHYHHLLFVFSNT